MSDSGWTRSLVGLCVDCGGKIAPVLARAGSLRCAGCLLRRSEEHGAPGLRPSDLRPPASTPRPPDSREA